MTPASLTITPSASSTLRRWLFSEGAQRGWLAALGILGSVVLVLASSPDDRFQPTLGWDKLNHGTAFFVLAFCAHFALRETPRGHFWVLFLLTALGLAIELIQLHVPGRSAEVGDLLADGVGMALGLSVALVLGRRLDRRRRPRQRSARRRS